MKKYALIIVFSALIYCIVSVSGIIVPGGFSYNITNFDSIPNVPFNNSFQQACNTIANRATNATGIRLIESDRDFVYVLYTQTRVVDCTKSYVVVAKVSKSNGSIQWQNATDQFSNGAISFIHKYGMFVDNDNVTVFQSADANTLQWDKDTGIISMPSYRDTSSTHAIGDGEHVWTIDNAIRRWEHGNSSIGCGYTPNDAGIKLWTNNQTPYVYVLGKNYLLSLWKENCTVQWGVNSSQSFKDNVQIQYSFAGDNDFLYAANYSGNIFAWYRINGTSIWNRTYSRTDLINPNVTENAIIPVPGGILFPTISNDSSNINRSFDFFVNTTGYRYVENITTPEPPGAGHSNGTTFWFGQSPSKSYQYDLQKFSLIFNFNFTTDLIAPNLTDISVPSCLEQNDKISATFFQSGTGTPLISSQCVFRNPSGPINITVDANTTNDGYAFCETDASNTGLWENLIVITDSATLINATYAPRVDVGSEGSCSSGSLGGSGGPSGGGGGAVYIPTFVNETQKILDQIKTSGVDVFFTNPILFGLTPLYYMIVLPAAYFIYSRRKRLSMLDYVGVVIIVLFTGQQLNLIDFNSFSSFLEVQSP